MKSEKDKNPLRQIHSLLQINYNLLYFFPVEKNKGTYIPNSGPPCSTASFLFLTVFYWGGEVEVTQLSRNKMISPCT